MDKLRDIAFDQIVPVSARRGDGMDELLSLIRAAMPRARSTSRGHDHRPARAALIAEIVREKALLSLREEIPHGVGVEMLAIEAGPTLTEIHANLYCERESHKAIIIGKRGAMLGKIGSEARADIERLLGTRVNLKLWVKVREDWRTRPSDLRTLGYERES